MFIRILCRVLKTPPCPVVWLSCQNISSYGETTILLFKGPPPLWIGVTVFATASLRSSIGAVRSGPECWAFILLIRSWCGGASHQLPLRLEMRWLKNCCWYLFNLTIFWFARENIWHQVLWTWDILNVKIKTQELAPSDLFVWKQLGLLVYRCVVFLE